MRKFTVKAKVTNQQNQQLLLLLLLIFFFFLVDTSALSFPPSRWEMGIAPTENDIHSNNVLEAFESCLSDLGPAENKDLNIQ